MEHVQLRHPARVFRMLRRQLLTQYDGARLTMTAVLYACVITASANAFVLLGASSTTSIISAIAIWCGARYILHPTIFVDNYRSWRVPAPRPNPVARSYYVARNTSFVVGNMFMACRWVPIRFGVLLGAGFSVLWYLATAFVVEGGTRRNEI